MERGRVASEGRAPRATLSTGAGAGARERPGVREDERRDEVGAYEVDCWAEGGAEAKGGARDSSTSRLARVESRLERAGSVEVEAAAVGG